MSQSAEPKMSKTLDQLEIVGGHPAVDFVNTVHDWTRDPPPDYLRNYTDLIRWNRMAGLIGPIGEANLTRGPERSRALAFREALALRADLHRLFRAIARGEPWPEEALAHLDAAVKQTVAWRQLQTEQGRLCCTWNFQNAPPAAVIGPVAWRAVELLENGELQRLKECPGEHCGWLFIDTSRNRSRTWCSMKNCGNTAKVRRFRKRQAS